MADYTYSISNNSDFAELVKKAKELARNKVSVDELKQYFMNSDGTFKGANRTGERYHNCILYMIASGKPTNSAIKICSSICTGKYGQGACMGVQGRVMRNLGLDTLEWYVPIGSDTEVDLLS